MKNKMTFIIAIGFAISSCNKGRDSSSNDEISGSYAREYSFKVVNQETSIEIGMRTIRDTIFIRAIENGYEVSNRKWKLNDYEKGGWTNSEHADDRPMSTYLAKFDHSDNTLRAESLPPLFIDIRNDQLHKGSNPINPYHKIK